MQAVQALQPVNVKPLILPFSTPLGHYIYETNKNEMLTVNEALYCYIKGIMDDDSKAIQSASAEVREQYNDLVEGGYLSNKHVQAIEHTSKDTLKLFLDRKIDFITLQVTQNCNLRCSYCVYGGTSIAHQRKGGRPYDIQIWYTTANPHERNHDKGGRQHVIQVQHTTANPHERQFYSVLSAHSHISGLSY